MPIYEYRCDSCAKEFEQMRPIAQSSEPGRCPACGGSGQKLVSLFASKEDYSIKVPRGPAFRGHGSEVKTSEVKTSAGKTTKAKS